MGETTGMWSSGQAGTTTLGSQQNRSSLGVLYPLTSLAELEPASHLPRVSSLSVNLPSCLLRGEMLAGIVFITVEQALTGKLEAKRPISSYHKLS